MIRSAVVVAAMSEPPPARRPNSASDPAATMTMSRGQSGPQNAVTAAAASFICAPMRVEQRRRVRAAETDRRTVRPSSSVSVVDAAVGVVTEAGAATTGPRWNAGATCRPEAARRSAR